MQNCNLTLNLSPNKLIITWKYSKLKICLNLLFPENHWWVAQCPEECQWKHWFLETLPGTKRMDATADHWLGHTKTLSFRGSFHWGHTAFIAQWCQKIPNQMMLSRERLHSDWSNTPALHGRSYTYLESLKPIKGSEPMKEGMSVFHDSSAFNLDPHVPRFPHHSFQVPGVTTSRHNPYSQCAFVSMSLLVKAYATSPTSHSGMDLILGPP